VDYDFIYGIMLSLVIVTILCEIGVYRAENCDDESSEDMVIDSDNHNVHLKFLLLFRWISLLSDFSLAMSFTALSLIQTGHIRHFDIFAWVYFGIRLVITCYLQYDKNLIRGKDSLACNFIRSVPVATTVFGLLAIADIFTTWVASHKSKTKEKIKI
jgi:hypothetical protein